jgi:hemerythrin superfamily protein
VICTLRDLTAGYTGEEGVQYPAWKQIDEYQRDHTAEAMGY